jgi:hypothetical protein
VLCKIQQKIIKNNKKYNPVVSLKLSMPYCIRHGKTQWDKKLMGEKECHPKYL